ncbi:MAG: helicase C-terminal domain-containing protein [Halobacteriales archaeon]
MTPERIVEEFPAPSFRGHQEAALEDIRDAFAAGNDVVLVRAPTGSGKSLLARAVMGTARTAEEAGVGDVTGAYYTTPQVSQLDAVAEDDLLSDLAVVRGKRNYDCILPEEDTTVDRAPCTRDRDFDCDIRHKCPYFSDRAIAENRRFAAMTLAYFMRTAGSETFGPRDVVVIDEAHGLAEWAEMYATIDLDGRTVPIWDDITVPDLDDLSTAVDFAESLAAECERRLESLRGKRQLTPAEASERDRLAERIGELTWFVEDARDLDSATEWLLEVEGDRVSFKPLNPARYLRHTVWDRGAQFALLSATILDKAAFCRGVGLDPAKVALVDVPHTFPLEHRPLYDVTQGRMTYEDREETVPNVARLLVRLMARHPEEKGIVHAHSYDIAEGLRSRLAEMGVGTRVRTHGSDDREDALAAWLESDRPDVFLSVTMEEALDLHGDLARWQVLCKAPYPNTNDVRVARRLQDDQWGWYYRTTLRTVIQACGLIVRSAEDHGATYLADSSLLDLFERAEGDMPPWFADQVAAMGTPDLPEFDPTAALSGIDGASAGSGGTTARGGASAGGSAGTARSGRGRSGRDDAGASESDSEDHPLHDVWGD